VIKETGEHETQTAVEFINLGYTHQSQLNVFPLQISKTKESRAAYLSMLRNLKGQINKLKSITWGSKNITILTRLVCDMKAIWDMTDTGWLGNDRRCCPYCQATRKNAHDWKTHSKVFYFFIFLIFYLLFFFFYFLIC